MLLLSQETQEFVDLMTLQGPGQITRINFTHVSFTMMTHRESELFKSHAEDTEVGKHCGAKKITLFNKKRQKYVWCFSSHETPQQHPSRIKTCFD